jgi:hypothetical protein
MSKLSHNKAVARRRRNKHGKCHHYTKKEMKQLMPNFKGKVFKKSTLDDRTITFEINGRKLFLVFDKNYQICDCSRIGSVFSKLQGRVLVDVDVVNTYSNELEKICG